MRRILSNHKRGINAENTAINYLNKIGYTIFKHRYKTKYGEIDLIAYKKNLLIFLEVKNRKKLPNYDIILNKQKARSCETAMYFLAQYNQFHSFDMRFDCFLLDRYGNFKYVENAWEVNESKLMGIL